MSLTPLYVTFALVAASAGAGYAALRHEQHPAPRVSSAGAASASGVGVRGSIDNLQPGVSSRLWLQIRNRRPRTTTVRRIRTRVLDAASGCPMGVLHIAGQARRRLRIPPHAVRRTSLEVTLAPDAGDACQGAVFPLRFRVLAKP